MIIQSDKFLHLVISLIATFVLAIPYLFTHEIIFLIVAAYTKIAICVSKEMDDWYDYGKKDGLKKFIPLAFFDILYNGLGIILGLIAVVNI
jgi:hypothetical protein